LQQQAAGFDTHVTKQAHAHSLCLAGEGLDAVCMQKCVAVGAHEILFHRCISSDLSDARRSAPSIRAAADTAPETAADQRAHSSQCSDSQDDKAWRVSAPLGGWRIILADHLRRV
jgi:hypothetical protein